MSAADTPERGGPTAPCDLARPPVSDFAVAFRGAVEASGLGLESIQRRLAQRGVTLSVATLSYWQTGSRTPGRRASLEAVQQLEELFGMPSGELVSLVPPPRPRGRWCVTPTRSPCRGSPPARRCGGSPPPSRILTASY